MTLLCSSFIRKERTFSKSIFNNAHNKYDSSYDFEYISNYCENPKELIGQELIFAPRSLKHKIGSEVSRLNRLKDSMFICFTTKSTTPLSEIIQNLPSDTAEFGLVDGSRFPNHYKNQFQIKENLTTNTYKPKALLTTDYPFGNSTKIAILIGTEYSSLAGKTFKIKDVTCIYDYYDSRTAYFYQLVDSENNEINFFHFYDNALNSMIHIKGYIEKIKLKDKGRNFKLENYQNYQEGLKDSAVFLGEVYINSVGSKLRSSTISIPKNETLRCIGLKYISLETYYFQFPAYEFIDKKNNTILVPCWLLMPFIKEIK